MAANPDFLKIEFQISDFKSGFNPDLKLFQTLSSASNKFCRKRVNSFSRVAAPDEKLFYF